MGEKENQFFWWRVDDDKGEAESPWGRRDAKGMGNSDT